MPLVPHDRSVDLTQRIADVDWTLLDDGRQVFSLLRVPTRSNFLVQFIGSDINLAFAPDHWGFLVDGREMEDYSRLPAEIRLGTVEVPILTAEKLVRDELHVFTLSDPIALGTAHVRIKGRHILDPQWQSERLAFEAPRKNALERLVSFFGGEVGR